MSRLKGGQWGIAAITWVDIASMLAGIATAIFAGTGVYLLLVDRRSRIAAQFAISFHGVAAKGKWDTDPAKPDRISVNVTVTNHTDREITITGLRATGISLLFSPAYDQHFVRRCPGGIERDAAIPVAVGQSGEVRMGLEVDWSALRAQSSSDRGASLLATVIIDRNTLVFRRASRTASKPIPADAIEKNAAKAAQK